MAINGGGHILFIEAQKMTASQNRLTEAVILFTETFTIVRLEKSIYDVVILFTEASASQNIFMERRALSASKNQAILEARLG